MKKGDPFLKGVVEHYHQTLLENNNQGLEYLKSKGLGDLDMICHFQIGFVDGSLQKKLSKQQVKKAKALRLLNGKGQETFHQRIVVPIFLEHQQLADLYGYDVTGKQKTPHLSLAGKAQAVWNHEAANVYSDELLVTETLLDALTIWSKGNKKNVIACHRESGWTDHHDQLISRNQVKKLVLVFPPSGDSQKRTLALAQRLRKKHPSMHCLPSQETSSYYSAQNHPTPPKEPLTNISKLHHKYGLWLTLQGYSEKTLLDFWQKLKPFFHFIEKQNIPPTHVNKSHIAAYQHHLSSLTSTKTGKRIARNTQINRLTTLKNFYRFLYTTERIAHKPTQIVRLPQQPHLLPPALLKPPEMKKLLEAPDLTNPLGFRDRTIMELFYSAGLRLSELLSLLIDDLDFESRLVHIRHGKANKERYSPLGSSCTNWLQEYLQHARPLFIKNKPKENTLFLNRFGRPIHKSGWQKKLAQYVKQTGLQKNFTTHCFRHQLATSMLERGADLRHIQELLGHDLIRTTQRYLHIAKKELRKVHQQTHPRGR